MSISNKFHLKKFKAPNILGTVAKTKNLFYYLKNGEKYFDLTSGWTSFATLGFNNERVLNSIKRQMKNFLHVDYNIWHNPQIEKLSYLLSRQAPSENYKIYFSGNSGSEAIEAAIKLSYQCHFNSGKPKKKIIISRMQSFHGATLQAINASDLPILEIFKSWEDKNKKIHQHNYYKVCQYSEKKNCFCKKSPKTCMGRFINETKEHYLERSVKYLEDAIKELGAENIAAFVGETQLGSLVGDVPALPGYWKKISELCNKNKIHLILDEVYCGMGRAGKFYNFLWEGIRPDFICLGKNTTGGHIPLSFVLVKKNFEQILLRKDGRIKIGHTFQGYSLGVSAAIETVKILQSKDFLQNTINLGLYAQKYLESELCSSSFFSNIRGRGLQFSLEHNTPDNVRFSNILTRIMFDKYKILINSKWHRTSFTPSLIISKKQIDFSFDCFIKAFKEAEKIF
jgi:adenosylmethionine-8-amino-7-oxononanoate aminotransferase